MFDADRADGKSLLELSAPLVDGVAAGPATEYGDTTSGNVAAVASVGGTPIVASDYAGALRTQRGSILAPDEPFQVQAQLGGCCSYNPNLITDAAGGVWVAWYSNATNNVGVYVQALDSNTGAPVGTPAKAPQSETVSNGTQRIAIVPNPTGPGVRLVYGAETGAGAKLRLVSWAPGEAAPVTIAQPNPTGLNLYVTAARRADGRLWAAWYDGGTSSATAGYVAKLGDARGAGGTAVDLGQPPRTVNSGPITSAALGNDLLVTPTVDTGQSRPAVWADVTPPVVIPNPRTIRSGPATVVAPKRASIGALKKGKCVNVVVTVTKPSRVLVTIFSGTKSIRIFGQARVSFRTAPAARIVCVRVPFRAHTFDVRTPGKIAIATKRGDKPATVTTRGFKFVR